MRTSTTFSCNSGQFIRMTNRVKNFCLFTVVLLGDLVSWFIRLPSGEIFMFWLQIQSCNLQVPRTELRPKNRFRISLSFVSPFLHSSSVFISPQTFDFTNSCSRKTVQSLCVWFCISRHSSSWNSSQPLGSDSLVASDSVWRKRRYPMQKLNPNPVHRV